MGLQRGRGISHRYASADSVLSTIFYVAGRAGWNGALEDMGPRRREDDGHVGPRRREHDGASSNWHLQTGPQCPNFRE